MLVRLSRFFLKKNSGLEKKRGGSRKFIVGDEQKE